MTRRAALTLALWLGALAACAAVIAHTRFSADLSAFLPASPDARQRALIEQVKSGVAARTVLLGIRGGHTAQRAAASRALAQRLRADAQFEQVLNGELAAYEAAGRWVVEHRYALSPAIDARRFTEQGLREGIDDTLSLLGTPAAGAVKPLLQRDPTGEVQRIAESALGGGGPPVRDGVWVSRDGARALLTVVNRADGGDLDAQARALHAIEQAFAAVASSGVVPGVVPGAEPSAVPGPAPPALAPAGALRLDTSGAPKFAVHSRDRIRSEAQTLALTGTLAIGVLLLAAFASLRALGAALLPAATGVVVGVAAVSLVFGGVHGLTLGFGITLIGEAVDYGIYYLLQAHTPGAAASGQAAEPGWRRWLREGWPTVRLGLLTSVCGFGALAFSGFPGLAQLGVFSVAGLVAAALTTRWVLPLALPNGAPGAGLRLHLARSAQALMQALPRARRACIVLGFAAAALLLWRHDRLWQTELSSLSPVPAHELALDAALRADLQAGDERTLIAVSGNTMDTVLQRVEAVSAHLDMLVQRGELDGYDAITRWLPSAATQAQRRAALPDAQALRTRLAAATAGGPLPARRLEPFISEVQRARGAAPITADALARSPLAPLAAALLVQGRDGHFTAWLPLRGHSSAAPSGARSETAPEAGSQAAQQPAQLQQALSGIGGVQVIVLSDELRGLYRRYLGEAQTQALLGALGVVLLMAAWLRSLPRLLAVCLPLLLAVLITMAGFTLAGVPLGILHLVGLLLVVAVGSNYALFIDWLRQQPSHGLLQQQPSADRPGQQPSLHSPRHNASMADTLASLLLANVVIVLSFGLLALSQVPALSAVGRVVAPGALLALLLSAACAGAPQPRARSAFGGT